MSSPQSTTGATNTYTTSAEIRHSIRPWLSDFLTNFTLPLSISSLSNRFTSNIYTYRGNYAIITIIIFILTLIFRPFTAVMFLFIISSWVYLLIARDEPLVLFDFEIGDRLVLIGLSVVTIVAVAVSGVWWKLFVSGLISGLVVSLHAILKTTDDDGDSPYGALLSSVDEDGPGSYVPV
uniref:PRA1 family protein D-like n=1 Tax=Erigeron canadensis TaxID=72917 RepID=UPI001CB8F015|nr:PRA1 family protein D-like [Erigeron canadensis]